MVAGRSRNGGMANNFAFDHVYDEFSDVRRMVGNALD
jgi:hypothetical protein